MALSGLDIYKLLPKTNCKECGFATCLAFAMQLAKKAVSIDKCPYLSDEAKRVLSEASLPPMRKVIIGSGEAELVIGGETVMFRHEEKFRHPCGIGFIIDDNRPDEEIARWVQHINGLDFERVGERLRVDLAAVRQTGSADRFAEVARNIYKETKRALVLVSRDPQAVASALEVTAAGKPLVFGADEQNFSEMTALCRKHGVALVLSADDAEKCMRMGEEARKAGVGDIVFDTREASLSGKIGCFTRLRRLALKESDRSAGFPVIAVCEDDDPYEEALGAATFIAKYAGIVMIRSTQASRVFSLLTLRQNIYTDPQKPLQIEPMIYEVGPVTEKSPLLITTNFSLSYFTVLGEVEASKLSAYIMSVDTEGMSVLTAWAAEKFTPERISDSLVRFRAAEKMSHKTLVLPGYVAVLSGDLQEASGWNVLVGPKEAAGIPSFLKKLAG